VISVKKALALIISVLFVFAVTSLSFAAAEKGMEKKAPVKVKQATGEVTAVDAKAKTITVKAKKGDVTAMVGDKTKIMMGKDMKTLADINAGDKVTMKYSESDGTMTAKSIAIKPAEKMMEKKMAPAAKPAGKK
jgi:Cu/Ag efflux protein CusF